MFFPNFFSLAFADLSNERKLEFEEKIKKIATMLPDSYWAGFEIHPETLQLDFHQGIRSENKIKLLKKINQLKETQNLPDHWQKIYSFCKSWNEPKSKLFSGISYIFLEFDLVDNNYFPVPALFIGFNEQLANNDRLALTREIIQILAINFPLPRLSNCFENCQNDEFISNIGFMLSRNNPSIRVNVRNLSAFRLKNYLRSIGYQYQTEKLEKLFSHYLNYVDRITICIDLEKEIFPRIGMECTILGQPPEDSRYDLLFKELSKENPKLTSLFVSLLKWPGLILPPDKINLWPDDLLCESLLRPNNFFSTIEKKVNHLKVDYFPDSPTRVKGYIAFEHIWLKKCV